ncbi:PD-(D/E)XK nuclease family protein [Helicobacter sp. MIT 05-5293]|uniref:PD-(D/E)XK nuclease family protein n=1 Tax=Helicobacter sp. MIT 05-5293 TaxID=1548149 RepID=UPI00051DCA5A|nr:PD-(D/E)XK nuclease family protein [Helicobacter sp. MIT 05-5293]
MNPLLALCVYSSKRSLLQSLESERLLAPTMLLGEFFTSCVLIKGGYRALPQSLRLPLMMSVLKEFESALENTKLVFEKSFLGFLESSQFVFGFFDEIAQSQVRIQDIPLADTYGDYDNHLALLQKIYEAYLQKLEQYKLYDRLILPPDAEICVNEAFIKGFKSIDLYIEGMLTAYEQKILAQIAQITPIKVHFDFDEHCSPLSFVDLKALHCRPNHRYTLEFPSMEIIQEKPLPPLARIEAYHFSLAISQVALIFAKIEQWLQQGVQEEDIVVILPDEGFIKYLALFDKARNLNYAMGTELSESKPYKILCDYLEKLQDSQDASPLPQNLSEWIASLLESVSQEKYSKELESIYHLIFEWENFRVGFEGYTQVQMLELLLEELQAVRLDDVVGGKIRVIGVLESRGFRFKKAVIVDFNEDKIPKIQDSDIFLNSSIRKLLKMPTMRDKESLQKHYYYGIFRNADEVAIAYVENENMHQSMMLEELRDKTQVDLKNGDSLYALLPQGGQTHPYQEDRFFGILPSTLSPSGLKVLLECRRKYYLKYLQNLAPQASEDNAFMGNLVHQCLYDVYRHFIGKKGLDAQVLKTQAWQWLETMSCQSALHKVQIELLKLELERFFDIDAPVNNDIEILALEQECEVKIGDFCFRGRIDRIQKSGQILQVIDYKYKNHFSLEDKPKKMSDFALNIYARSISALFPQYAHLEIQMQYWDIKGGEIHNEVQGKDEELLKNLSALQGEIEFYPCENRSICRYCDFVEICNRD